jgi:hypothetical protein
MRLITLLIVCCVLSGCAGNPYKEFYKPDPGWPGWESLPNDLGVTMERLLPNQEPQIIRINDIDMDLAHYASKRYFVLGTSSFSGRIADNQYVIEQAKNVGATLILTLSNYTHTRTNIENISLGSGYNPVLTHQDRYDQDAWFLAKFSPTTPFTGLATFGFNHRDLSNQERIDAERNTGIFVTTVYEDTPMFYANALPGDIIIAINGIQIKNNDHYYRLVGWDQKERKFKSGVLGKSSTLTILRKGEQKDLVVQFDAPNDK